jgi:hypothetical protein
VKKDDKKEITSLEKDKYYNNVLAAKDLYAINILKLESMRVFLCIYLQQYIVKTVYFSI